MRSQSFTAWYFLDWYLLKSISYQCSASSFAWIRIEMIPVPLEIQWNQSYPVVHFVQYIFTLLLWIYLKQIAWVQYELTCLKKPAQFWGVTKEDTKIANQWMHKIAIAGCKEMNLLCAGAGKFFFPGSVIGSLFFLLDNHWSGCGGRILQTDALHSSPGVLWSGWSNFSEEDPIFQG